MTEEKFRCEYCTPLILQSTLYSSHITEIADLELNPYQKSMGLIFLLHKRLNNLPSDHPSPIESLCWSVSGSKLWATALHSTNQYPLICTFHSFV